MSRPQPSGPTNQPPAGPPTGEVDQPDGITMPGWAEAPLIAATVASGLATALAVLRLRRRRSYQPSPPALSSTGPQPASQLRRLATTPTSTRSGDPAEPTRAPADDLGLIDASVRRLSEVEIGRRDDAPLTLDLLDQPGLAVTGRGADSAICSLLADLLLTRTLYDDVSRAR